MENLEVWKEIKGYEDSHLISNLGKIKSLQRYVKAKGGSKRQVKGRIIKQCIDSVGYFAAKINNKTIRIHRILGETFLENPTNLPCINHINGIKTDNSLQNLEWCSYSENNKHAYDIKLKHANPTLGEKNHLSKLSELDVISIKNRLRQKEKQVDIAKIYNITQAAVSLIKINKNWKHLSC